LTLRTALRALCLLALVLAPRLVAAQGSTATLSGIVRDQQNLIVPGATVTVAGTESSFSRNVVTGPDGDFDFPGLQPGEYLMTVELAGFERRQLQIRLEVISTRARTRFRTIP
jgi:hypothetical protein